MLRSDHYSQIAWLKIYDTASTTSEIAYMIMKKSLPYDLKKGRKAVSPAISTTILTGAVVVMLVSAVIFSNNYLGARMAENEFNAMKQFMQAVCLQVDDVAWIPGRTETARYASKYGQVNVQSQALNYLFYFNGTLVANFTVSVVMFSMPATAYSISNNYFERIFPSSGSFLHNNTLAPVCGAFAVEKSPMSDGSYIRIVVAPLVRQMNSLVGNATYVKLYVPILQAGSNPQYSTTQSITLTGVDVLRQALGNAYNVTIVLNFPKQGIGLTSDFFNFERLSESISVMPGTVVEIYAGEVHVSLGLYS